MSHQVIKSLILSGLLLLTSACSLSNSSNSSQSVLTNGQLAFSNAQLAVESLQQAVSDNDSKTLAMLFGPDSEGLLNSGDKIADRKALSDFAAALAQGQELQKSKLNVKGGSYQEIAWLLAGDAKWPFPIPLVKQEGLWHFETEIGQQEILHRRIGENELRVIDLTQEYVNAQHEYFSQDRDGNGVNEFAQKFLSTAGKKDGLYWQPVDGEAFSPMGPLVAMAGHHGYVRSSNAAPQAFHGYYYRILTAQTKNARGGAMNYIRQGKMTEGFALLAYPAEWDNSGVMTFLLGPDGVLYQKNLGPDTTKLAAKITKFDPDLSWQPVALD